MIVFIFLLFLGVPSYGDSVPDWFIPLRDAVYEQRLSANEIAPLYRSVSDTARRSLSGPAQYVMLSRCEYMMGRAYQYEERKDEAAARYSEGISLAERAIKERASAEAYQMLAENISQSCAVRSVTYAMANGLKVERYSKSALDIDRKNGAARIMIAARWVYAPAPFHNYNRGIEMMQAIPGECNMDRDDLFNVYIAVGYAYIQQRNKSQARVWISRSLEVYPTNKYAQSLLAGL